MRNIFFILFIIYASSVIGQNFTLDGTVRDQNNISIPFANIISNNDEVYGIADENGKYLIKNIPSATYTFNISAIGFQSISHKITISQNTTFNFTLKENIESLDNIVLKAKSASRRQNEKAVTITSLGTQKIIERSLGAEELLKESTGVVVRQSGGLGSNVNINLNGLSQRAVRVFYDGIPVEVFGGGIQLNTIPVDALDRIDVYKGVIPVDVGTDALGGGINLIPLRKNKEYLRASYSVGSFNTHRLTLNGRKNISDKVSISALSYFNYSDNDYVYRNIENSIIETSINGQGQEVNNTINSIIDARAFNNRHISGYAEAAVRIKDLSWTDQLEIAATYATRDDQVQNGIQLIATSIGEVTTDRTTFSGRIDYRKKLFKDKLAVRYYGVLARTKSNVNDSTQNTYNWLGDIIAPNGNGSEIASSPTIRQGINLSTAHRLVARYDLFKNLNLTVSHFYRRSEIDGKDPLNLTTIGDQEIDLNTIPSILKQNIFGAQLETTFLENKITAQAFYKNYDYQANSVDFTQTDVDIIPTRTVIQNNNGYGFALKYSFTDNFFIRSSFEKALRMPSESEVFGDFSTILPNFELSPEQSDNLNLGIKYTGNIANKTPFSIGVDAFIRNREDLIRLDAFGPDNAIFINEQSVDGKGVELSLKVTPIKNLRFTGNFTTQSNEISSVSEGQSQSSLGAEVPNIPLSFYNLGANYTINNIFTSKNSLELYWNYIVVNHYSINEVDDLDTATQEFIIPTQEVHNLGSTFRFRESGLSFSLAVNNLFNDLVFDNWRVPRPGINYTFKVNYSIF